MIFFRKVRATKPLRNASSGLLWLEYLLIGLLLGVVSLTLYVWF